MLLPPVIALRWRDKYAFWRDRLLLMATLARSVSLIAVAGEHAVTHVCMLWFVGTLRQVSMLWPLGVLGQVSVM